ncbi:hydrolytic protein [Kitasatospora aureofaciens]|uniref:COG1470 family protein n=1 Tax=Kitasatospora aureofaciens TaxID=1894 RepID=UPI001C45342E|nr:hydrolytic protein [Kitasatospora aureofaciens]MBV6700125.1 hydrolytic protein [Kitasatospora aureofaciens]
MTTSAELGLPALTVAPGVVATTTLTVRNGLDIVEAYSLEVVGDCAAWTTVEPARVSLYPGTSATVTVRLAPPRSPAARAGEFPLGIRVLPAERPELVTVPETTVTVTPFHELQAALAPRRRRGWLRGRYRTSVRNLGNTPGTVVLTPGQAGEELRFRVTPERLRLEPGESGEMRLQARARKLIWFGKPASWPFEVTVGPEEGAAGKGAAGQGPGGKDTDGKGAAGKAETAPAGGPLTAIQSPVLEGEFTQLSILPKWLLALLAALLALLLAWFALVRPAVRSSAKQAAEQAVAQQSAAPGPTAAAPSDGAPTAPSGGSTNGQGKPSAGQPSAGAGSRGTGPGLAVPGTGQQSSATIDVQTANGASSAGSYQVPHGKVFDITDIVVANFQGDQGLLTITAGKQTITTIALETFRNQDYHWVTPIQVPEDQAVTVNVTCESPGTPASGKQASTCHELLNISGALSDIRQGN